MCQRVARRVAANSNLPPKNLPGLPSWADYGLALQSNGHFPAKTQTPAFPDPRSSSESAALRLTAAERPEEILPILLEEIVHLGFPSAVVLELDFDTGQVKPSASLNCTPEFLEQFNTSLWASENAFVSALLNLKSVLAPDGVIRRGALYAHPMIYRNSALLGG